MTNLKQISAMPIFTNESPALMTVF